MILALKGIAPEAAARHELVRVGQQGGTSGSRLSIPRETLELCGIFLHTNPIRKEPSNWFRKRVPVNEGELAEAVAEVSGNEFVGPGMRAW